MSVSVVMPFAGSPAEAARAVAQLARLSGAQQRIFADNCGSAPPTTEGVIVVAATGERSPAHARNAGAAAATGDWLLFLDADTEAPADLVPRYFDAAIADDVGALAGQIVSAPGTTLASRYGAAKGFLDSEAHLAHPFLPRAAAANLLVRRAAFESLGGFREGLRAAEDTDFCWRLQRAGWRLEGRPDARVAHRYRQTIGGLRRQWRAYAAGRAWLARRYEGFRPEPALLRVVRRSRAGGVASASIAAPREPEPRVFAPIDVLLGIEELVGLMQSNAPPGARALAPEDEGGARRAWRRLRSRR